MEDEKLEIKNGDFSVKSEDPESYRKVLKPIKFKEINSFTEAEDTKYQCRRCGEKFFKVTNFCSECGQKLK